MWLDRSAGRYNSPSFTEKNVKKNLKTQILASGGYDGAFWVVEKEKKYKICVTATPEKAFSNPQAVHTYKTLLWRHVNKESKTPER